MRVRRRRVQLDGAPVGRQGLVVAVHVAQRFAQVGTDAGAIGAEGQGAAVTRDGRAGASLYPQGDAHVGVGIGVPGVQLEGPGIAPDGGLQVAPAVVV